MSDTSPWWFKDAETDPDALSAANILMNMRDGRTMDSIRAAVEGSSDEEEDGEGEEGEESEEASADEAEETDDDNDAGVQGSTSSTTGQSAQAPRAQVTTAGTSPVTSSSGPGSILLQGEHWRYKHPMAQPLRYRAAADANGGERILTYGHQVNFDSRESVNPANKAWAQEVYRARKRFDLPLARESMVGREYTLTHFDWISIAHEAYRILHNGRAIPWSILTLRWNFCWGDGRTEASLRGVYSRNQEFQDMRR